MTVEWHAFGDDAVVIDRRRETVSLANAAGRYLLALDRGGLSRTQMVEHLVERHAVDTTRAAADVATFFGALEGSPGLVFKPVESVCPDASVSADASLDPLPARDLWLPPVHVKLRCNSASIVARLCHYLPSSLPPRSADSTLALDIAKHGDGYGILIDGQGMDSAISVDEAVFKALRHLCAQITRDAGTTAIFHAAAVARGNHAILLPGQGGQGKTTLCAYLLSTGHRLINDDTVALLEGSATLLPVPLPLSIKRGSWSVVQTLWPALGDEPVLFADYAPLRLMSVGSAHHCDTPVSCRLVVLPGYDAACNGVRLRPLSPADCLSQLASAGCFLGDSFDAERVLTLLRWLETLPIFALEYASLAAAGKAVDALLDEALSRSPADGSASELR